MSEQSSFQVGKFVSPLTAATTKSLLEDADPALAEVLAFFQAIIQTHLGARWDAEVTKAGLPALVGKMTALAIPYDPAPFLLEAKLAPPLLAIFPVSEKPESKTVIWYHANETWTVQWVLPPLTPAQYLALYPFLRAVAKVITDRVDIGFDPSYQGGARFSERAGLEEFSIVEISYGELQKPKSDLMFPCLDVELNVFERRANAPGVTSLTGIDGTTEVADEAGSEPLIETEQDFP